MILTLVQVVIEVGRLPLFRELPFEIFKCSKHVHRALDNENRLKILVDLVLDIELKEKLQKLK